MNWANIYVDFQGYMMPVQASDIGEDGTLTDDPNLVNNDIYERVYTVDEEGNPVLDEDGNPAYEMLPTGLIVETTEVTEPAETTEGPANRIPDK